MGNCVSSHRHFAEDESRRLSDELDEGCDIKAKGHMHGVRAEQGRAGYQRGEGAPCDGAARFETQLDMNDIWRLVHRDIEMEYLAESQDATVSVSSDTLRDQVAKEISSLRSQLERSQAALHALQTRSLPLERANRDRQTYDAENNNLRGGGTSPLLEALTLVDFESNNSSNPRQVQGTASAESILDHDFYNDASLDAQYLDSTSCPQLLDQKITSSTQTERGKVHHRGTKRGRAPHVSASKYAVVNSSTGSSTSGVDVSSISSRSDSLHVPGLPIRKSVFIVENPVDSLSSPDDVDNPLVRLRTPSFKRAIERGASGDSSNISFETVDPTSTSSDLSPERPDVPPSYLEHIALRVQNVRQNSPRRSGSKSRSAHRKHLTPPPYHKDELDESIFSERKGDSGLDTKDWDKHSVSFDDGYHEYLEDGDTFDVGIAHVACSFTDPVSHTTEADSAHSRRLSTLVEESDQEMTDDIRNSRGLHRTPQGSFVTVPARFLGQPSPPPPKYKQPPGYRESVQVPGRDQSPANTHRLSMESHTSAQSGSLSPPIHPQRPNSPSRHRNNRVYPEPSASNVYPETPSSPGSGCPPSSSGSNLFLSGSQKAQLEFRGSPPDNAGASPEKGLRHDSGSDSRPGAGTSGAGSEEGRQRAPSDGLSSVGRARRKSLQDMKQQTVHKMELTSSSETVATETEDKMKDVGTSRCVADAAKTQKTSSSDGRKPQSPGESTVEDDVFAARTPASPGAKLPGTAKDSGGALSVSRGGSLQQRDPTNADSIHTSTSIFTRGAIVRESSPNNTESNINRVSKEVSTKNPGSLDCSVASNNVPDPAKTNDTAAKSANKSIKHHAPPRPSLPLKPNLSPPVSGSSEKEVFPSLPDSFLQKLGLAHGKNKSQDYDAEQSPEQEIEEKFASLSLAFRTDRITLDKRIELHQRARDIAEQNIIREMEGVKEALKVLERVSADPQSQDIYSKLQHHVQVLEQSTARMSSRAEMLGAVQQECRISLAIDVMLQHVDNLKQTLDKEHLELEETKKLLQESKSSSGLDQDKRAALALAGGMMGAKDENSHPQSNFTSSTRVIRRTSRMFPVGRQTSSQRSSITEGLSNAPSSSQNH